MGGINDVHGGFGKTFVRNTVISGNGPGSIANNCDRLSSDGGGNVIGNGAGCNAALVASDRVNIDPQLGPLTDLGGFGRSHVPGPPLLDSAEDATCTQSDQRGITRPQDGDGDGLARCDVGAVELQGDPPVFADGFE